MLNTFSSWLFNIMLWGAVVSGVALSVQVYTGNLILTGMNALISLGAIVVISLFWPKY